MFDLKDKARRIKNLIANSGRMGGDKSHPWYYGLESSELAKLENSPIELPLDSNNSSNPYHSPIMFLARGHSGTTVLARILEKAGVFMGNINDRNSLNITYDSLYWAYGFQRYLVPRLFKYGQGCINENDLTGKVGNLCYKSHMKGYRAGPWGFKTCEAMFSYPLYNRLFPNAKYIYLVRDGRDVILSNSGFLSLASPFPKEDHREYFKIITFGIFNDFGSANVDFRDSPEHKDILSNRFWIQAKSWKEHARMMDYLKKHNQLTPSVYLMKYEKLCTDPLSEVTKLFDFLGLELSVDAGEYASRVIHNKSVGRWENYEKYTDNSSENIEAIFDYMGPELRLLGYI